MSITAAVELGLPLDSGTAARSNVGISRNVAGGDATAWRTLSMGVLARLGPGTRSDARSTSGQRLLILVRLAASQVFCRVVRPRAYTWWYDQGRAP